MSQENLDHHLFWAGATHEPSSSLRECPALARYLAPWNCSFEKAVTDEEKPVVATTPGDDYGSD